MRASRCAAYLSPVEAASALALISNPIGDLVAGHAYLRRELPRRSTLLEKCERAHGDDRPENNILFPRTRALIAP